MKTRFCTPALTGLIVVCLSAAVALGQDAATLAPQKAYAEDYSVDHGTAFVTDAGDDQGAMLKAPAMMPQFNPGLNRVPAQIVASSSATENQAQAPGASMASDGGCCSNGTCSSGTCSNGTCSSGTCTSGTCSTCNSGTSGTCNSGSCSNGSCNATRDCNHASCDSCDACESCDSCHRHCHGLIQLPDYCPLECCDEEPCRAFDCCWMQNHDTSVYGWIDGGIIGNDHAPSSHFNGPVTFPDRDDGQLNQFYGVLERTAACDNTGWFVGGRADLYWGSDFFFTTAAGLDGQPQGNVARWNSTNSFLYGWSMPQLYAEVDYDDVRVKAGHFYSPIGYEVAPAVENFFYTHSYARQYGEPFTHTGVLASQPLNENWTWYAGIDNGWNAFDCDSRANFLGGLKYSDDCWGSLGFMIQTGDDSTLNLPGIGPFANRTTYSLVWERNFTSRLTYVLEHNLGIQQDAATIQGTDTAEWYGISQYLFYRINPCWTAGVRFEWFRDDDGFVVTGQRPGNPLAGDFFAGNFYETSVGLNWKPNSNVTIRPEVRWDWFNGISTGGPPFNDNTSRNQFLFGLDAIVQF